MRLKRLYTTLADSLEDGKSAVLVTVVDSDGSTPRKAGSVMAVLDGGVSIGTVGGGALEYEAQNVSSDMLKTRASDMVEYSLASNELGDICMICGGGVTVHYNYLSPCAETAALFRLIAEAGGKNESSWIIYRISGDGSTEICLRDPRGLHGAVMTREADVAPLLGRGAVLTEGEPRYYTAPLGSAGRVFVFGGGHIGQDLVPVLARVGFKCVVYEDRGEYAAPELFPDAYDIVQGDFGRLRERITVEPPDYAVIVTRGHKDDFRVLEQILATGASYIGCIGSRRKIEITKARLRAAGAAEADVERVFAPIGLPIGAQTPEEIAISIAAQLILHRAESN